MNTSFDFFIGGIPKTERKEKGKSYIAFPSDYCIVDIETIKHTNEQLISTMDEVLRIQAEGKERRRNAEQELSQIEQELKTKLLEASKS